MRNPTYLHTTLLVLILALGVFVRVSHFPHVPPGLNQDEAASAYEAYSLAETGCDKWGNPWPAYFPAWGSGQNVLLAYLTVPVIKLLGLNLVSARLVMLLTGLLTLPLFYYCLRPVGRYPALLGLLLLAVAPWHFMLSRWALESNLLPFWMLLGCTTLSTALITQQRRWIILSLVPFALSLYAYGTTMVVLPVLLAVVALLHLGQLRAHWRSWLLATGLFLLVGTPFFLFFCENYVAKRNFAWTDSLFFSTPLLTTTRINQVASDSWSKTVAYNWDFLLLSFDDGTSYNLLPGFKLLLSITLPFTLIGLLIIGWKLVQRRGQFVRSPAHIVLATFAAWWLASLTLFFSFDLNINRFNHIYLPCLALAAWAIATTIDSFKPEVPTRVLRLGALAWLLLEGGQAISAYFGDYPTGRIKADFNDGLGEAFGQLAGVWGYDQVRVTELIPFPYVYTAFFLRYPPAQFQRDAKRIIRENGTYHVQRLGHYIFSSTELRPGQPYAYLSRKNEFPDTNEQHRQVIFTNDAWEVGVMQIGPASN